MGTVQETSKTDRPEGFRRLSMNELLLTLSEKEISVILFNLEEKYGHLLDGEIPEEVQTIFSKLEGAVDEYYDGQESEFDGQVYTQGWTKTDEIHEISKFITNNTVITPEDVTRTQLKGIKGNLL